MKCTLNMFGWKGVTMKNHKKLYIMHTVILNDIASGSIWKWMAGALKQRAHFSALSTQNEHQGMFLFFIEMLHLHPLNTGKKTKPNHTLWQSIEKRGCYYFAHFYHLLNSMEKRKQRIWKESLHHGTVV